MTTPLDGLIERVERCTGPDRELDLALATALVPDVLVLRQRDDDSGSDPYTYWQYTGKIDDALALVERKLPPEWGVQVGRPSRRFGADGWYASVFDGGGLMFNDWERGPDGDIRPRDTYRPSGGIAIILAFLSALQSIKTSETPE